MRCGIIWAASAQWQWKVAAKSKEEETSWALWQNYAAPVPVVLMFQLLTFWQQEISVLPTHSQRLEMSITQKQCCTYYYYSTTTSTTSSVSPFELEPSFRCSWYLIFYIFSYRHSFWIVFATRLTIQHTIYPVDSAEDVIYLYSCTPPPLTRSRLKVSRLSLTSSICC